MDARVKPAHDPNVLANAAPPVLLAAPGTPSSSRLRAARFGRQACAPLRERSAEKRGGLRGLLGGWRSRPTRLARRVASVVTEARLSALHCGDFSPRGRASGRGREGFPSPIQAAFAALRPCRVQPSKAAPHSRGGRRPEASRCRGYEPQQQAPHPAPSSKRLAKTPSVSRDACRNIVV